MMKNKGDLIGARFPYLCALFGAKVVRYAYMTSEYRIFSALEECLKDCLLNPRGYVRSCLDELLFVGNLFDSELDL